jgi:predicted lipoprotein
LGATKNTFRTIETKLNFKMPFLLHKHFRYAILLLALVSTSACKLWTIRPIGWKENKPTVATQTFKADDYVNSIWDSKIVPLVNEKAVDLTTVLNALDANVDEAKKQFGVQSDQGATFFFVKGEGKIKDNPTQPPQGTITLKLLNYKGKTEVVIQLGTVFRGTVLRDAVGFIKFNDFANQVQFAEVSTKLHEHVLWRVIGDVDLHPNDNITFQAVFSFNDPKKILLTPVRFEWHSGGRS